MKYSLIKYVKLDTGACLCMKSSCLSCSTSHYNVLAQGSPGIDHVCQHSTLVLVACTSGIVAAM